MFVVYIFVGVAGMRLPGKATEMDGSVKQDCAVKPQTMELGAATGFHRPISALRSAVLCHFQT